MIGGSMESIPTGNGIPKKKIESLLVQKPIESLGNLRDALIHRPSMLKTAMAPLRVITITLSWPKNRTPDG